MMSPDPTPTQASQQDAAGILKLFEHERRIAVVEKDTETLTKDIVSLTREVYQLPATLRDMIDEKVTVVRSDADAKFQFLTAKLDQSSSKIMWFLLATFVAIVTNFASHFIPWLSK